MKIILVSATMLEVESLIEKSDPEVFQLIITGVGGVSTAYHLTKLLQVQKPDLLIQAGIAGSLDPEIKPGQVVAVKSDRFADLGVAEESWKDIFQLGLASANQEPFTNGWLKNTHTDLLTETGLPLVNGISVNEITTRPDRIKELNQLYKASVESMEGAAFHFVCIQEKIPFLQIRAISNYVGERNKSKWKIKESIELLNDAVYTTIQKQKLTD